MQNEDREAIQTLAKVIKEAALAVMEEAPFDKTVTGVVVAKSGNDYVVQCLGAQRTLKNKTGMVFKAGDPVYVLIPMNNTSHMFISGGTNL